MMKQDKTIIVVGGGAIGVSAAYYLSQRGARVVLLEQNDLASGSSSGNAGQITPGHLPLNQPGMMFRNLTWLLNRRSPLYIPPRFDIDLLHWLFRFVRASNPQSQRAATKLLCRLGGLSFELYEQLASTCDFEYRSLGRLEVASSARGLARTFEEAELLRQFGFESERLSPVQISAREPALRTSVAAGGVYYPQSAHCDPRRFVLEVAKKAVEQGTALHCQVKATSITNSNNKITVSTSDGREYSGDHLLIASGAWPELLQRAVRRRAPIQPGKGYHVEFDCPNDGPKLPVVLVDEKIFATPIHGSLRFAGTMELSGYNLCHNQVRIDAIYRGARRYFPAISGCKPRSVWCHWRPMSPDGLPLLGPCNHNGQVWIATGHGMLGVTQAPATGKILADWMLDGDPPCALRGLSPMRFA